VLATFDLCASADLTGGFSHEKSGKMSYASLDYVYLTYIFKRQICPNSTQNFYQMFFEKLINTIYSFGAAVVIFGAWGKIEHKDFGSTALTIGLLTETCIFCIYGFMEWQDRREVEPRQSPETNGVVEVDELTATMKQTNRILNKVFKED
jgi:hypothetical protein